MLELSYQWSRVKTLLKGLTNVRLILMDLLSADNDHDTDEFEHYSNLMDVR